MRPTFRQVSVLGTRSITTGGAEVLHQLVHELNIQKASARIVYVDAPCGPVNPAYTHYVEESLAIVDEPGACVVVPETLTGALRTVRSAHRLVWWLSVDNYLAYRPRLHGRVRDIVTRSSARPVPLAALRSDRHLVQSVYAGEFLASNHISSAPLTDYLADVHFAEVVTSERRQQIAVNPKKGAEVIAKLRRALPEIDFVELVNMSPHQLRSTLESSMLYADFGHHPGKDRIPREAAMAGCCVVVGSRGSAGNLLDVPVPTGFRLDEGCDTFIEDFRRTVTLVFNDFRSTTMLFNPYREEIRSQRVSFAAQVEAAFFSSSGS